MRIERVLHWTAENRDGDEDAGESSGRGEAL